MAETIKKHFPKRNFYKQIAEFDNNLFIFDNWKWLRQLSCQKSVLWKKKFFYDFKTGNYIISRVICKERHSF